MLFFELMAKSELWWFLFRGLGERTGKPKTMLACVTSCKWRIEKAILFRLFYLDICSFGFLPLCFVFASLVLPPLQILASISMFL